MRRRSAASRSLADSWPVTSPMAPAADARRAAVSAMSAKYLVSPRRSTSRRWFSARMSAAVRVALAAAAGAFAFEAEAAAPGAAARPRIATWRPPTAVTVSPGAAAFGDVALAPGTMACPRIVPRRCSPRAPPRPASRAGARPCPGAWPRPLISPWPPPSTRPTSVTTLPVSSSPPRAPCAPGPPPRWSALHREVLW